MLENTIKRYQNKSIETAQIIEELIELAKEMREARHRGEELNLSDEELAFYDALEVNNSAVAVLGDETLRTIARELVDTIRNNLTIDWTLRESVQAKLRGKGQTNTSEVRVSSRQAEEGNRDRAGTGSVDMLWLRVLMRYQHIYIA